MATAYIRTREQLRDKILRKLRVLGADDLPSSADADIVYEAIDLRLKELHRLGALWWKTTPVASTLTLVASTASSNAPADLLFPLSVSFLNGTDEWPLDLISHKQYAAIADKTRTGSPEQVHYANGVFYFYPTPQANGSAKLTYEKIIDNSAAGTAVDVPSWAIRSLVTLVAADLADDFQVQEERVRRLIEESKIAERELMTLNAPHIDNTPVYADYF